MATGAVLCFRNGVKRKTLLVGPIKPDEDAVNVFLPDHAGTQSIPLGELSYVGILGSRDASRQDLAGRAPRQVETLAGERFSVGVPPDGTFPNGFFAVPADDSVPFEILFFVSAGIKPVDPNREGSAGPAETGRAEDVERARRTVSTKGEPIRTHLLSRITGLYHAQASAEVPYLNQRVGDILIDIGLVTREQVDRVLETGEKKKIGTLLVDAGFVTEEQLLSALATKFSLPFIDLTVVTPSSEAIRALSKSLVNHLKVLPIELQGKRLVVATSEPTDNSIVDSLRFVTNCHIELAIAVSGQIAAAIEKYYNVPSESLDAFITAMAEEVRVAEPKLEPDYVEPDSKVILLVNRLLLEAQENGASDIHFEPELGSGPLTVRYRVDGECVVSHEIPAVHKTAVIARLKIMSKLDIAERRKPQSGKIFLHAGKKRLEYRLEVTPTVEGNEDAVLRLLTAAKPLRLAEMGFSPGNLRRFQEILAKPYGIILCAGPTGSGKTTTLHSALAAINTPDRKIWTAEDPVEIVQKGLRQVQVNPRIGFGFEEALRSFLRADPDVIMIGEMRDTETSRTAVAASLTGHLVFSTLHTNSAPETVRRLIEIGLDPFNFADALLGVLAQRLARKLCDQCKVSYLPSPEEYREIVAHYGEEAFVANGMPEHGEGLRLMKGKGCAKCGGTGYRGRVALHELLVGSAPVKTAIKNNLPVEDLRALAMREGMRTLKMDGIEKVFQGVTDLRQILKVCIL